MDVFSTQEALWKRADALLWLYFTLDSCLISKYFAVSEYISPIYPEHTCLKTWLCVLIFVIVSAEAAGLLLYQIKCLCLLSKASVISAWVIVIFLRVIVIFLCLVPFSPKVLPSPSPSPHSCPCHIGPCIIYSLRPRGGGEGEGGAYSSSSLSSMNASLPRWPSPQTFLWYSMLGLAGSSLQFCSKWTQEVRTKSHLFVPP